jgi:hypothetical protein
MSIETYLEEFGDAPVFTFLELPGQYGESPHYRDPATLPAADSVAWHIGIGSDSMLYENDDIEWTDCWAEFLDAVDSARVQALLIGAWNDMHELSSRAAVKALVRAQKQLPALRALFLGDVVREESEVAYIIQSDIGPILKAYPELEDLRIRGGHGLEFPQVRHERLRKLVIESVGLSAAVVQGIADSEFPALTHLELWLGHDRYGADYDPEDLLPLLSGEQFPNLTHLALRNSDIQDDICVAVAEAALTLRLRTLDLSLGVLTDTGAEALLLSQSLGALERLDLHHNYLSPAMCAALRKKLEPAGVELNLDPGAASYDPDEYRGEARRYVAVGE